MLNLIKQISRLDERLSRKSDLPTAIALALRCWQAYRFLEPSETRVYIQRANHTVIAAHRRNTVNIKLYALTIFIAIEAGHYDSANEMLDKAMGYKAFLRGNEPFFYGVLCFLYAYLELHQKRVRSARKHWRAFTEASKGVDIHSHYQVMQGLLHLASGEFTEAYNYLTSALRAGCESVFLYEGLFRYYRVAAGSPEGASVLPVLIYAASRGADIAPVAERCKETLSAAIAANPQAGEKLYAVSNYPPLLEEICAHRIAANDLSREAYAYYREAENKQIFVRGLFNALVQAAYANGIEKINHYPMSQFLSAGADMEMGLAVYVFHLLLTDPDLSGLLPDRQSKIMQLGARCLEKDIRSREANSIYYYFWIRCKALGITGVDADKAEEILRKNAGLFELCAGRDSAVRYVYITEPEKRGMAEYELPEDGSCIIIEAVSEKAAYTCLGPGRRAILDERISIKPMVEKAGAELYSYFFKKGDRRFHLIAELANHYLSLESPPDEATPVFEAVLQTKGITKQYRNRILVALGRLHYNAFSFDEALECYGAVDDDALGNDFIGQILSVYMQTREYARAARLLMGKYIHINGEALFEAVNALLAKSDERESIAILCYKLLMAGFFSEEILSLVLEHFNAGYTELSSLSQTLEEDNRQAPRLDALLIEKALHMAIFDTNAQKAFVRLWVRRNEIDQDELMTAFVELATYEMVANSARPEYDVLDILEKWYIRHDGDVLLAWGLAGTYLRYSITTFKSEEILASAVSAMEAEGILFPVFKENKHTPVPFIEKHQPFLYRGLPGKDCWLYYRISGASVFTAVPMRYVKYGLYAASVPMFYNEELTYYFSEEMPSGSITTKEAEIKNTTPFLYDHPTDPFFTINNAIIYEQLFKHDRVEEIISRLVKDVQPVRSRLL